QFTLAVNLTPAGTITNAFDPPAIGSDVTAVAMASSAATVNLRDAIVDGVAFSALEVTAAGADAGNSGNVSADGDLDTISLDGFFNPVNVVSSGAMTGTMTITEDGNNDGTGTEITLYDIAADSANITINNFGNPATQIGIATLSDGDADGTVIFVVTSVGANGGSATFGATGSITGAPGVDLDVTLQNLSVVNPVIVLGTLTTQESAPGADDGHLLGLAVDDGVNNVNVKGDVGDTADVATPLLDFDFDADGVGALTGTLTVNSVIEAGATITGVSLNTIRVSGNIGVEGPGAGPTLISTTGANGAGTIGTIESQGGTIGTALGPKLVDITAGPAAGDRSDITSILADVDAGLGDGNNATAGGGFFGSVTANDLGTLRVDGVIDALIDASTNVLDLGGITTIESVDGDIQGGPITATGSIANVLADQDGSAASDINTNVIAATIGNVIAGGNIGNLVGVTIQATGGNIGIVEAESGSIGAGGAATITATGNITSVLADVHATLGDNATPGNNAVEGGGIFATITSGGSIASVRADGDLDADIDAVTLISLVESVDGDVGGPFPPALMDIDVSGGNLDQVIADLDNSNTLGTAGNITNGGDGVFSALGDIDAFLTSGAAGDVITGTMASQTATVGSPVLFARSDGVDYIFDATGPFTSANVIFAFDPAGDDLISPEFLDVQVFSITGTASTTNLSIFTRVAGTGTTPGTVDSPVELDLLNFEVDASPGGDGGAGQANVGALNFEGNLGDDGPDGLFFTADDVPGFIDFDNGVDDGIGDVQSITINSGIASINPGGLTGPPPVNGIDSQIEVDSVSGPGGTTQDADGDGTFDHFEVIEASGVAAPTEATNVEIAAPAGGTAFLSFTTAPAGGSPNNLIGLTATATEAAILTINFIDGNDDGLVNGSPAGTAADGFHLGTATLPAAGFELAGPAGIGAIVEASPGAAGFDLGFIEVEGPVGAITLTDTAANDGVTFDVGSISVGVDADGLPGLGVDFTDNDAFTTLVAFISNLGSVAVSGGIGAFTEGVGGTQDIVAGAGVNTQGIFVTGNITGAITTTDTDTGAGAGVAGGISADLTSVIAGGSILGNISVGVGGAGAIRDSIFAGFLGAGSLGTSGTPITISTNGGGNIGDELDGTFTILNAFEGTGGPGLLAGDFVGAAENVFATITADGDILVNIVAGNNISSLTTFTANGNDDGIGLIRGRIVAGGNAVVTVVAGTGVNDGVFQGRVLAGQLFEDAPDPAGTGAYTGFFNPVTVGTTNEAVDSTAAAPLSIAAGLADGSETVTASVGGADPEDFFTLSGAAGQVVVATVIADRVGTGGTGLDAALSLIQDNGNGVFDVGDTILATNDDGNVGLDPVLSVMLPVTGTFFLMVAPVAGSGTYSLDVEQLATVRSGNIGGSGAVRSRGAINAALLAGQPGATDGTFTGTLGNFTADVEAGLGGEADANVRLVATGSVGTAATAGSVVTGGDSTIDSIAGQRISATGLVTDIIPIGLVAGDDFFAAVVSDFTTGSTSNNTATAGDNIALNIRSGVASLRTTDSAGLPMAPSGGVANLSGDIVSGDDIDLTSFEISAGRDPFVPANLNATIGHIQDAGAANPQMEIIATGASAGDVLGASGGGDTILATGNIGTLTVPVVIDAGTGTGGSILTSIIAGTS
ncbi:MAG: hypothetical protein HY718_02570, partial [Planctomycetes bacterium]|nr:hypothetical protein [Planctomycetota bacterium]